MPVLSLLNSFRTVYLTLVKPNSRSHTHKYDVNNDVKETYFDSKITGVVRYIAPIKTQYFRVQE